VTAPAPTVTQVQDQIRQDVLDLTTYQASTLEAQNLAAALQQVEQEILNFAAIVSLKGGAS
jgi:hypothetical protein